MLTDETMGFSPFVYLAVFAAILLWVWWTQYKKY
jgi:hypothetical protein